MVYRARQCSFIVDQERTRGEEGGEESREHCPHCRILSLALASKDPGFSEDSPGQLESDLDGRRKRGRPKGSRKRIREEEREVETANVVQNQEQILRELAEEVQKQERIPLEETQATI